MSLIKKEILKSEKWSLLKQGIFVFSALIFFIIAFFIIFFLSKESYGSNSSLAEIVKILQLCFFVLILISLAKKISPILAILIGSLVFFFQFVLSIYFLIVKKRLDFAFFSFNGGNLPDINMPLLDTLSVILFFAFFCGYFFVKIKIKGVKRYAIAVVFLIIFLLIPVFKGDKYLNETLFFIKSAFGKDETVEVYQLYYDDLVEKSIVNKKNLSQKILQKKDGKEAEERPKYLDNIIFLQLESINGKLSSKEITPNLYQISKNGMRFSNYYANGVQTILGQENLLCSLPSSFYSNLNATKKDKEILCLPEVFNQLGYQTAFFKTYNLNFTNTGEFMHNIGFAEVHADDIMQEGDPQYNWGYREDIFYKRAFSYIGENFQKKNNFLFLEVGPTNHWPFITPQEFVEEVPHKNPENQKEKLENTMFLQDKQLKVAWDEINKIFPEKNYTVIITGDHSWPSGEHPGNSFCGSGAFEENFKTELVMVFGDGEKNKNEIIEEVHSHMDVLPSFFHLFNLEYTENEFQKSFLGERKDNENQQILLVQPFSEKFVAIIDDNFNKYIYNSKEKSWKIFDLKKDADEKFPLEQIIEKNKAINTTEKFFPLVKNNIVMHALGGINGFYYTNSKEALEKSLERKRKIFEVDITLSSDQEIVLSHEEVVTKTKEQFLNSKATGGFTPLSLEELMQKMKENPEIILITDIKNEDYGKTTKKLFEEIRIISPELLNRIIPQIYDKASFEMTKQELGFEKMAYTLYKNNDSDNNVFDFVEKNKKNIPIVVMSKTRFNKELNFRLQEIGVTTFVHTLNNRKEILKFRKLGVDGVFTDSY